MPRFRTKTGSQIMAELLGSNEETGMYIAVMFNIGEDGKWTAQVCNKHDEPVGPFAVGVSPVEATMNLVEWHVEHS